MSEQGGKLLRLADHPRYRSALQDPELVETEPGVYLTRTEFEDLQQIPQDDDRIDWENCEGLLPLTPCEDCKYALDLRNIASKLICGKPGLDDLKCSIKGLGKCDQLNPEGSCDDFDVDITYA